MIYLIKHPMSIKPTTMSTDNKEEYKFEGKLIDEFKSLIGDDDQFPIPVELLSDLNVYNGVKDVKRIIEKAGFMEGREFCIDLQKHGATGGRPRKDLSISGEGFKSLCMLAQNEQGRQAREYFLTIEKLWNNRPMVETNVNEKIQKLEAELREEKKARRKAEQKYKRVYGRDHPHRFNTKGPAFYIISSGKDVKIGKAGISKQENKSCDRCKESFHPEAEMSSIDKRLVSHRTLWPDLKVEFIVYTKHASYIECGMKKAYKNKKVGEHEIIRGVPVEKVIQKCKNILEFLDSENEESCYRIEPNIENYNSARRDGTETEPNVITLDLGTTEISHVEVSRAEIQYLLVEIKNMDLNHLKDLCRRFHLPILRNKPSLISLLSITLNGALMEPEENYDLVEEKIPEFNMDNLPPRISPSYEDGKIIGFRVRAYYNGNQFGTVFNDKSIPMETRYEQAWTMLKDMDNEFKLTGTVNTDAHRRKEIVRQGICLECGVEISPTSSLCLSCSGKSGIQRPEKNALLAVARELKGNLSAMGRQYKKSDTAIRKWLKSYGITSQQISDRTYY